MGLGFTKAFLEHGANVFIASRDAGKLDLASKKMEDETGKIIEWKVMDVREESSVEDAIEFDCVLSLESLRSLMINSCTDLYF